MPYYASEINAKKVISACSKDLLNRVATMHRKGVVFSKMFVLRSMGNELVPSPQHIIGRSRCRPKQRGTKRQCRNVVFLNFATVL